MAVHLHCPSLQVDLKSVYAQGYATVGQLVASESFQKHGGKISAFGKTVFAEKDDALVQDTFKGHMRMKAAGGQWLQTSRLYVIPDNTGSPSTWHQGFSLGRCGSWLPMPKEASLYPAIQYGMKLDFAFTAPPVPSQEPLSKVLVDTQDGDSTAFMVDLQKNTALDLLKMMSTLKGFSEGERYILFDGDRLCNKTLASHDIRDGDELHCVMHACGGMYHVTSGRFDLQNIGEEEALRIQGAGAQSPWGHGFSSPLYRVVISTPSGEYVIGCLGWDRMTDVKRKLLEVVQAAERGAGSSGLGGEEALRASLTAAHEENRRLQALLKKKQQPVLNTAAGLGAAKKEKRRLQATLEEDLSGPVSRRTRSQAASVAKGRVA